MIMIRFALAITALSVVHAKGPGNCRGDKGGERYGRGRGPPPGDHKTDPRKPASLLNTTAALAAKPLLDARAEKLWDAFKHTATDKHEHEWAHAKQDATSRLALAIGLVDRAARGPDTLAVANSVWEALPATDRERHAEAWAAHKGDAVLQLALALSVLRSPAVHADEAQKAWLTAEELKGIYEADVKAAIEAWKHDGEVAPDTPEATRLLVGCMAVASNIEDCEVQAEWARKCHECEQEQAMRHHDDDDAAHPPWLVAAIGVSATLALFTAICIGCLIRSKKKAATAKKSAEAPAWPESKLEAMAVAEKEAKLGCIDGVKVDSKVDVEVGYSA